MSDTALTNNLNGKAPSRASTELALALLFLKIRLQGCKSRLTFNICWRREGWLNLALN